MAITYPPMVNYFITRGGAPTLRKVCATLNTGQTQTHCSWVARKSSWCPLKSFTLKQTHIRVAKSFEGNINYIFNFYNFSDINYRI